MLLARSPYAYSGRTFNSKTSAQTQSENQNDFDDDDEKSAQDSDERSEWDGEDEAKSTQSAHGSDDVFQSLSAMNEEELVNSEEFARELQAAINHVQAIAKIDRQKMLSAAREHYRRETGDDPTQQMMDDAMRTFVASESDIDLEIDADNDQTRETEDENETETESEEEQSECAESEESAVDEQFVCDQLDLALDDIRRSASVYREEFVNKLCDIYRDLNGAEPSTMDLHRMIDEIKQQFADEAELDENDSESASEAESTEETEDELEDALEHVRELGAAHQSEFVDTICDALKGFLGKEPSTAELREVIGDIKDHLEEEAEEDSEGEEESEDNEFRREMDSALEHIRKLGRAHQTQFIDNICDIYRDANDEEPSTDQLSAMFHVIKREFVDEAAEENGHEQETESDSEEASEDTEEATDMESEFDEESSQIEGDDNYDPECDDFDYTRDAQDRIDFGIFATAEVSNPQSDVDDDEDDECEQSDDSESESAAETETENEQETDSEEVDDAFDEEMAIALDHVRKLGKLHRQSLVETACTLYARVNGEEPTADELRKIFAGIRDDFAAEAEEDDESEDGSESESESENEEESEFRTDEEEEEESVASTEVTESDEEEADGFAEAMDSALDRVSRLAESHQEQLVNTICDIYAQENGHEIKLRQLHAVFDQLCVDDFELTENDESTSEEEEDESVDSVSEDEESEETESEDECDDDSDYDPQFDEFDYTRDAQDRIDLGLFPDDDVLTSTDESEYEMVREPVVLEVFSAEMQSALTHVRKLGKQHQKEFLGKVCDAYEAEQEKEKEVEDDKDALSLFANIADRKEFESALDSVRTLGGWHQETFVNRICDDFVDLNGKEPTISELHGLIGGIKQNFAEEANEVENTETAETTEQTETELDEVNSAHFATEFEGAMENASMMGQIAGRAMLQRVREQFVDEFGEDAIDQMMVDAMQPFGFVDAVGEEETEDECEEEDMADLNAQMESALEHTRELGRLHQSELIDSICNIYAEHNSEQPTLQSLRQIFVQIREDFADETQHEFFERFGEETDGSDPEMSEAENALEDNDVEDESDSVQSSVENSGASSEEHPNDCAFYFYDDEHSATARAHSEDEEQSQNDVNEEINDDDAPNDRDSEFGDSDDYCPATDTFDYWQDIDDDAEEVGSGEELRLLDLI